MTSFDDLYMQTTRYNLSLAQFAISRWHVLSIHWET